MDSPDTVLTTRDLAVLVRSALYGFEAQELQDERGEIKVRVVLPESSRASLANLEKQRQRQSEQFAQRSSQAESEAQTRLNRAREEHAQALARAAQRRQGDSETEFKSLQDRLDDLFEGLGGPGSAAQTARSRVQVGGQNASLAFGGTAPQQIANQKRQIKLQEEQLQEQQETKRIIRDKQGLVFS